MPVNIMSGGSTGTYNIDHETGLSELEAGTYVFLDTEYFVVGGRDDGSKYQGALTPRLDTVALLKGNATGNAGDKFRSASHSPHGNSCRINCRNCTYERAPRSSTLCSHAFSLGPRFAHKKAR